MTTRKLLFAAAISTAAGCAHAAAPAVTSTRPLFRAMASATRTPIEAAVPLRNAVDRPACGNLGQRGQGDCAADPAAARPAAVPLQMSVERPLTNAEQRPACANLVGKGGRQRVCDGVVVAEDDGP